MITITNIEEVTPTDIARLGDSMTVNEYNALKQLRIELEQFRDVAEFVSSFEVSKYKSRAAFLDPNSVDIIHAAQAHCKLSLSQIDKEIRHLENKLTRKFNEVEGI